MLAAAIAADSGRGGGGAADPFAGTGIKFKEVKTPLAETVKESHWACAFVVWALNPKP